MDAAYPAYERGTELNEGLAAYVQQRAEGVHAPPLPAQEFGPAQVRQRAYATGAALALLLDRASPGWSTTFEADDKQMLDGALSEAIGKGDTCAFEPAERAAAGNDARRDVATLVRERTEHLAAFESQAGWRIVIETPDSQPLWPEGFDPLNVEQVAPARVLHTRFVKLGNDGGQVEVPGARALSDGIGPHPLFQGIRRVEVTGLAKPSIDTRDGTVRVHTDKVDASFKDASVSTSGQTVLMRLPAAPAGPDQ